MRKKLKTMEPKALEERPKTYIVKSLEQAKLLADPLRLRLLQAFVHEPRTTKQVAEFLGENPPKLYRHVDALQRAGLLELKAERRKRGTIERYLQAVAVQFVVDPSLFIPNTTPEQNEQGRDGMIDSILEMARAELKLLPRRTAKDGLKPLVLRAQMRATAKSIERMHQGLRDWLKLCHDLQKEDHDEKEVLEYVATIAFYPLGKS